MRFLSFGSVNHDLVYELDAFVEAGQTVASRGLHRFLGGKGLNQALALARAGMEVALAGAVGQEDLESIKDFLQREGVASEGLWGTDEPTGHAIIQRLPTGENCILIHAGANHRISPAQREQVLDHYDPGDVLLLQNEVNGLQELLVAARKRQMQVVFNPSPLTESLFHLDYGVVDYLICNEGEAQALTEGHLKKQATLNEREAMAEAWLKAYPRLHFVMSLGSEGACYADAQLRCHQAVFEVDVRDTTGAGDCFTAYFLASLARGYEPAEALRRACAAAALAVTRPGTAVAMPQEKELLEFLA